ncbi:predicted protein [Naegleria gruberi]|uniref:Predicted protein n=1 Tax=Naegleria gruberi TaxID=5762 RepID=D2UY66_NAEGR|nr:uncharacterized protein NAEGRDRAFT_45102 [Naegleria gruberi]EFC50420.1 predicted protein [Naegleria gruberi]|eukprot:XP_002683164.1 predicted protein [Naegleria gruberi strain NEG-M]
MHFTKPIEIPLNRSTYHELDYNRYCQHFRTISKPTTHPCVSKQKKPILLEHPKMLSNLHKNFSSQSMKKLEKEILFSQPILKQSYALHEDELLEEMVCMIKNHKLAKQKVNSTQEPVHQSDNEETRRLFVSNSLTIKFLEEQDVVLITVSEELQISQVVDANFHLKVGRIVKKLEFDECLVEVGTNDIVTVPSFCLCLEDRVLFDRMQTMRNKMIFRRSNEEINELEISMEEKQDVSSKPKRKFKSC